MTAELFERVKHVLADRFSIQSELGRGAMATVYLAFDVKHERLVAVKVMSPELAHALGPQRFLREIKLATRLSHPQILPVYDSGEADGLLYYVMRYVEGESLRHLLDRERQLPLEIAFQVTRDVADALDHAHNNNVVHRDIKPGNILLEEGRAFVADFGIARAIDIAAGEKLTETGLVVGTPAYMSPEQSTGSSPIDGRSDIYSLGCVLYEMLAGEVPFNAPTAEAMLARRLTDPLAPLRTVRDTVPLMVERAVVRALALVPADRFATAAQFAEALSGAETAGLTVSPGEYTIAVLDFTNISGDPAMDWLTGGIAETVTVDLKKTARVKVIGRERVATTLATFRDGPGEVEETELGRALGVRWIVSGGFQAFGGTIRITPRFVDTHTNEVVSVAKIDGTMDELFALQDQIVTSLMGVLEVELTTSEIERIERPETGQLKAYEHYAKGRQLFTLFGPKEFARARQYFEKAIEIDPEYALAYSGLGSILIFGYIVTTRTEDLEAGVAHLQQAIGLDQHLGEAYTWLTYAYIRQDRYPEAERMGERAIELEPDSSTAHYFLAVARLVDALVRYRWTRLVDAVAALKRAIELDADHQPAHMVLGWMYMLNGQYPAARPLLDRAVEIEEAGGGTVIKFVGAPTLRAVLDLRENRLEEARVLYEHALERLASSQHVYAAAFTALTLYGLGECAYRTGAFDVAIEHFTRAAETVEQNPEKLGIGYLLISAQLGLARAFHALHMLRDEAAQADQAARLIERRGPYDFHWMWEACDAQAYYNFASYHAAAGRVGDAATFLERAVQCGWGDLPALASDPAFERYGDRAEFAALEHAVVGRGQLP